MSGLDLNKLPAEDDIQGTELNVPEPLFCTQAVREEIVEESPDNDTAEKVEDGGNSGVHSARGDKFDYVPPPAPGGNHEIPSNTVPTATSIDPNLADEGADGVPLNEEVASSLQEPFLGMRFDTIADAREHYNAYAKKLGFSIKSNTSHRQAFTNELRKQTFVCNKNRQPKTEEEKQKEKMNVVEEVSPIQIDGDNEEGRKSGYAKKSTPSNLGVRRKRESIKQTKCEAKMIVKLVNNKWEVTYFRTQPSHGCQTFIVQVFKITYKVLFLFYMCCRPNDDYHVFVLWRRSFCPICSKGYNKFAHKL
uniref:Uncharacterized protein n=1 Tax=Avena sativa TaxID=4498 RepID=A0ACD5VN46_AVESA